MRFDSKNVIPRYMLVVIVMTLVGFAIIFKAAYLMFNKSEYWERVHERLEKRQKKMDAVRGSIYSADGQMLVGSIPIYTLHIDFLVIDKDHPKMAAELQAVRDSTFLADVDSMCMGLHEIFPDKSAKEFKEHITAAFNKRSQDCVIRRNVSYIDYKRCCELPYLRLPVRISGYYSSHIMKRLFPFDKMAIKTLGVIDADGNAVNGLELAYDSILRGTDGKKHLVRMRSEWTYKIDVAPVNGMDIVSTIDVRMQDAVEKAIKRQLDNRPNTELGMAVLLDVPTGDVKAIASISRMPDGTYEEHRNNVISDAWEPGSTFKTASIMVGLEDGLLHMSDSVHVGDGRLKMYGSMMTDHNAGRGGYQKFLSLTEIMKKSSNIGVSVLIDKAYNKHPEKFVDGLFREGMGIPLGLPFRESRNPVIRRPDPDPRKRTNTALPWSSIGYETMLPPISTVAFYNGIANGGRMVRPRFVTSVKRDGMVVDSFPVVVLKERICSKQTLENVQGILKKIVNEEGGLGKNAAGDGFLVSGKTGTAKIAAGARGYKYSPMRYLLSFCGYFPSDAPRYSCIVCFVQHGGPASGGLVSGSVFSEIANSVMNTGEYRNINDVADSTYNKSIPPHILNGESHSAAVVARRLGVSNDSAVLQHIDTIAVNKVPNVVGMGARDAVALMERCGLRVQIKGNGRVKSQSVTAGSPITRGQRVVLTLGPL